MVRKLARLAVWGLAAMLAACGVGGDEPAAPGVATVGAAAGMDDVVNKSTHSVAIFSINPSTGALTSLGAATAVGSAPEGIVLTP